MEEVTFETEAALVGTSRSPQKRESGHWLWQLQISGACAAQTRYTGSEAHGPWEVRWRVV